MLFGPIVSLEMITGARRARYFIVRVLYALVLFVVLWINYSELISQRTIASDGTMSTRALAEFSRAFFATFAVVQMGAVLMLTPAMIAGAIAQERERRTIEYLFASTLTGTEIILSKFLARTLHVASLLLVGMPILALAMMLGGIDPELLVIVFAATLATLVATASLSIATSVWAKRSRDAVMRTYLLMLAFLILPPLTWTIGAGMGTWDWLAWLPELGHLGTLLNPFTVLSSSMFNMRPAGMTVSAWEAVWPVLVVYAGFSVAAILWSIISVRRVYRKSIGSADGGPRRRKRHFRWRPGLGNRPMLWKELFAASAAFQLGWLGRIATALLFAGAIVPAIVMYYESVLGPQAYYDPGKGVVAAASGMVTTLGCGALLVVTIRAASSITAEKERDSWISLISTPLEPGEIVWAKIAGSIYAARWFALPVGVWWTVTTIIVPDFVLVTPILLATFGCLALALSAVGVWFSSWCRTSIRAMASAVAVSIFVGGGYLLCCSPVLFRGSGDSVFLGLTACIPFLLAVPGLLWQELVHDSTMGSRDMAMMAAYVFGTGAYLVLGLVVSALTIGGFNQIVGRPSRTSIPFSGGPPRYPPSPTAGPSTSSALATESSRPAETIARVEDASDDAAGKA